MSSERDGRSDRPVKAGSRTTGMHGVEKSDGLVVPTKPPNETRRDPRRVEEVVEGRGPTLGNTGEQNTSRTQSREVVSSALDRVREAAKKDKGTKFTALLHHVTIDRLRAAYRSLKKRAAPGVDGVTWEQYGQQLEKNLEDLHGRVHRGAYRAKPSRRSYIPKPDGRQRPLGIAAVEDKIVQAAVVEVLEAIYEADFLGFSYGFRPQRGPHRALDALVVGIKRMKVNWVLDADIRGFFDTIDHGWLMKFIEHRVADPRMHRLIQKWLNAGVLDEGVETKTKVGVPQGAPISPLLANIYLHYVLDLWAHQWRKRHAKGDVVIVRYADDFVVGFEREEEARRFLDDLRERLRKFGLELHDDKTRRLRFGRFAARDRERRGEGKPETFEFLGFTHICGKARDGKFLLLRHSSAKRMRATLTAIKRALRRRRHEWTARQGAWLQRVLRGWFGYHAVPTNRVRLDQFWVAVKDLWWRSLRRRSQTPRGLGAKFARLVEAWLPHPQICHPWPEARFDATTRRRSRVQ